MSGIWGGIWDTLTGKLLDHCGHQMISFHIVYSQKICSWWLKSTDCRRVAGFPFINRNLNGTEYANGKHPMILQPFHRFPARWVLLSLRSLAAREQKMETKGGWQFQDFRLDMIWEELPWIASTIICPPKTITTKLVSYIYIYMYIYMYIYIYL